MNEREVQQVRGKEFERLMREIQRNPEQGLHKFYDAYAKLIQTTAQAFCRSLDKANEVVDDVLVKIWKLAPTIGEIQNPEGWLYVITANAAKDVLREPYALPLEENLLSGTDDVQEMIDRDSFHWLIKDLAPIEKRIMIYRFIFSYTFQEMASELEKPLTTVSSLYYRGLEKIRKEMEKKR